MSAVPEETMPGAVAQGGEKTEEPTVPAAKRAGGRPELPDLRLVDEEIGRREDEPRPGRPEIGLFSVRAQEIGADGQWVDAAGPNQDSMVADNLSGLLAVADGVGGQKEGEKASKAACDALRTAMIRASEELFVLPPQERSEFSDRLEVLLAFVKDDLDISPARFAREEDLKNAVQAGFAHANQEVVKNAPNGATTLSAGVIFEAPDGKQRFLFANRGDSRIYRYRAGALEQLTRDDSLVYFLKKKNLIADSDDESEKLSGAAHDYLRQIDALMKTHYETKQTVGELRNVIMSALGKGEKVDKIAVSAIDVQEDDIIVAISDGVCDNLTRVQLTEVLERNFSDSGARIAEEFVRESKAVAHSDSPRAKEDDTSAAVGKIRAGVSLDEIFTKYADVFYDKLQTTNDQQDLTKMLKYLYTARNQAEMAMRHHPENRALVMLHDHILARLRTLDERVKELKSVVDNRQLPDIDETKVAAAG